MEELLADLERRVSALQCLPPPTRRRVIEWAHTQTDPQMLQAYLSYFLVLPELLQTDPGPALTRLCNELIDEDSEARVLARFNVSGVYDLITWLAAETRQATGVEQVYSTANKWALMLPVNQENLDVSIAEARNAQLFVRFTREGRGGAISWAEAELGITVDSYSQSEILAKAVLPLIQTYTASSSVQFIAQLGERLIEVGRTQDASAILNALLWSVDSGAPTEANIGECLRKLYAHLMGFLPNEAPDDVPPELAARFEEFSQTYRTAVAVACSQFAEALASADRLLNHHGRSLALLSALLEVWPEPVSSLRGLDRLRRTILPDLFRRLLNLWADRVAATNRDEEAIEWLIALYTGRRTTDREAQLDSLSEISQTLANDLAKGNERVGDVLSKLDDLREHLAAVGDAEDAIPNVWRGDEAVTAAHLLMSLALAVGEARGPNAAITLLCAAFGFPESALSNRDELESAFGRRFSELDGPTIIRLAATIAQQLWGLHRTLDAIAAFEVPLGLDASAYVSSDTVRARLRPYLSGDVPEQGELRPFLQLAILLNLNSRGRHAVRLMLSLEPELCESWDIGSYERLRARLGDYSHELIDEYITRLGLLWLGVAPGTAAELLAAHLHVTPDILRDREQLANVLHTRRRRMPGTAWMLAAQGMMLAKADLLDWSSDTASQIGEIVAIGEAALNLNHEWYRSKSHQLPCPDRWDESLIPWQIASTEIAITLGWTLSEVGRAEDALTLFDTVIHGVFQCSYRAPEFIQRLNKDISPTGGSEFLQLIPALFQALHRAGKKDELFALAQGLAEAPDWFQPGQRSYTGVSWNVIDTLLPVLAERDLPAALRLARSFVPAFRAYGLRDDVIGIDRVRLINFTRDVRHHLIQTGHDAILADPSNSATLRLETLCWDAELGQLMLRERFDRQAPRPNVEAQALPAAMPFEPQRDHTRSVEVAVALRAAAIAPTVPPTISLDGDSRVADPDAMTLEHLASTLDSNERLLRVGFASNGALVWTLFATDENQQLRVLCTEQPYESSGDTRARIVEAVLAHDDAMARAWANYNPLTKTLTEAIHNDLSGIL